MQTQTNQIKKPSPRLSPNTNLSFNTCVRTLSGVGISKRGLLNLELSVGLAIFLDAGVANKSSKGMLSEVYQKAHYDCAERSGKHYSTVNRRIQASAGLFGKIGTTTILGWIGENKESKLLQSIAHKISEYNFESMDDVLDFVGRTSNRTSGAAKKKSPFDIEIDNTVIRLPKKLSEAQLIELASKILALAEEVKVASQEAQEAQEQAPERVERAPYGEDRRREVLPMEVERRAGMH